MAESVVDQPEESDATENTQVEQKKKDREFRQRERQKKRDPGSDKRRKKGNDGHIIDLQG